LGGITTMSKCLPAGLDVLGVRSTVEQKLQMWKFCIDTRFPSSDNWQLCKVRSSLKPSPDKAFQSQLFLPKRDLFYRFVKVP